MPGLALRTTALLAALALAAPGCDDTGGTPPAESCANGADDDGDGSTDCDDTDCTADLACAPPDEDCGNGLDDDEDGATDCGDTDCAGTAACVPPFEDCGNGLDDDGDGSTDCADTDCAATPECLPPFEDCGNGLDDDGDGSTDCDDDDCDGDPACVTLVESCRNGLDDDGDAATDCDDDECAGTADCVPPFEDCTNRVDDDGDTLTDCDDDECAAHVACRPSCGDDLDPFEPNDDAGSATDAATVAPTDTAIAVAGDPDVFSIAVCRGGVLTVDVRFAHAGGDIDVELVEADGGRLAGAWSADDDEQVVWTGDRLGDVYLAVGLYGSEGCNEYTLEASLDDGSCIWNETTCDDGIDDDGDGWTDCADAADCGADPYCAPESDCLDGVDNDADGATDCLDPGCRPTADCNASGNDTCAEPFVLPDDPSGTWYGDTTSLAGDYRGTCAGDGRDAIFELTVSARGELSADLQGSTFDTVLYLRSGACATGTQVACNDDVSRGTVWSRVGGTLDPGTYYLFVDGFDAAAHGRYALNVDFAITEICDDAVDNDGDGATDCADGDCRADAACVESSCGNSLDDDGDGATDCDDIDCTVAAGCYPAACAEDPHEDNDTLATALPIDTLTPDDVLAVTPSDDDFWSIDLCAGAVVEVDARFRHADGDVDIYLQDSSGVGLAESNGAVDNEYLTWTAAADGTVYLRVDLYGTRDPCNVYRLGVRVNRSACP